MTAMPTPQNKRHSIMDRSVSSRPSIAVSNLRKSVEKIANLKKGDKQVNLRIANPESWFKKKRLSKDS